MSTSVFHDCKCVLANKTFIWDIGYQLDLVHTSKTPNAMGALDVPGAILHYETRGRGPLFLLISSGIGPVDTYTRIANELSRWFTVVTYNRRGFSRSHLTDAQDYSTRLQTDADDARRLIEHLSPHNEPATVMGTGFGAIVALELLVRHPSAVRMLIPFEPPALNLIPNGASHLPLLQNIYDIYRRAGPLPAIQKLSSLLAGGAQDEAAALRLTMDARRGGYVGANTAYWFERELAVYPAAEIDVEVLRKHRDRVLPAAGRESVNSLCYVPNMWLAERLEIRMLRMPGGHLGFAFHAKEFAEQLLAALRKRDGFYRGL